MSYLIIEQKYVSNESHEGNFGVKIYTSLFLIFVKNGTRRKPIDKRLNNATFPRIE